MTKAATLLVAGLYRLGGDDRVGCPAARQGDREDRVPFPFGLHRLEQGGDRFLGPSLRTPAVVRSEVMSFR